MYLGRAKKTIVQIDELEFQEKEAKHAERTSKKKEDVVANAGQSEELPDGACFRLKSVNIGTDDVGTATRPAEYIGSFSVNGEDQTARTEFVQCQLESMHNVEKSKKVLLVISLSGVKVCSSSGESVYMAHALKRISYAACDPEHRQFAFLAREPKGHINIQFCHAFVTTSPEEAEELNTIIGNAFKMAYAQQKTRQPTFNELIERQLIEQKAKFAEYQEKANRALQQRLTEIATPTAIQRMEVRKQPSSGDLVDTTSNASPSPENSGKNKIWAKHTADKIHHRSSPAQDGPVRSQSPTFSTFISNSQQQRGTRNSDPNFAVSKRNSTPVNLSPSKSSNLNSNANSPKRNSTPHLSNLPNFQVVTIRESLENNVNNSNRFKGSPVTALKDEIDRRYSGGGTLDSGLGWTVGEDLDDSLRRQMSGHHYDNEDQSQAPPASALMQNRPLPAIPASSDFNDHRASPKLRYWTSLDDDVIPNQMRSTMQARLRDSPKRRPQRPQSEVILDSKLSVFSGTNNIDQPGVYIYGFKSQTQNELSKNCNVLSSNQLSNANISPNTGGRPVYNQQRDSPQKYSPKGGNYSPKGNSLSGYDNMHSLQNGNSSSPIHYQNGSPTHLRTHEPASGGEEFVRKNKEKGQGLESLMGLDRSHIEDETLRHSCWYQAGIPRDVALEILQQEDIGSFIVRDSSTHPGCYALSVRVPKFENPTGISHYLILKTARGVKLKGLDKEWSNLLSLVTHHTVMPEMLPCTLRLPRDTKNPAFKASDKDDKEEDPDYQRLADFSSMMEALKK